MARENLNDIVAFLAVARERNFTKAAAKLGVSQSALSHTIRTLETRLGLRLLTRTTRSVSPTEAGERLLSAVGPHIESVRAELDALGALRDKPSGKVRITAGLHVTETILWPKLQPLLRKYPDVNLEIIVDYGLANIVADRFDAGVRLGEQVAKDMVAVRIGPDFRFVVVAAPSYFKDRSGPKTPQDLTSHNCINLRMPTYGGIYAWEFERAGRELNVRVEASSRSIRANRSWMPCSREPAWPIFRKTPSRRTSNAAGWRWCWTAGARPSPATTCIFRAGGSRRRPCRWSSKRCGTSASRHSRRSATHEWHS